MKRPRINTLWLGVGLALTLFFSAWAILFHLAATHPTASVPLTSAPNATPAPAPR